MYIDIDIGIHIGIDMDMDIDIGIEIGTDTDTDIVIVIVIDIDICRYTNHNGAFTSNTGSPEENEAPGPAEQLARISIADNVMTHLSLEYSGGEFF